MMKVLSFIFLFIAFYRLDSPAFDMQTRSSKAGVIQSVTENGVSYMKPLGILYRAIVYFDE